MRWQMKDLYFREDGSFTIVQFTDVHWKNGESEDHRTTALMKQILETEKPDLVVFTGDSIQSEYCRDPLAAQRDALQAVDDYGVPWAAVFGNHDMEKNCTKPQLIAVQQEFKHCLTQVGPDFGDRLGNYLLEVKSKTSGKSASTLYMFDSGADTKHHVKGYEWITQSQINWYREQSRIFSEGNGGVPLLSLAFFHIPLPEYNDVWNYQICYGQKSETIGGPRVNSGLFTAFLEMGDVKGTFVGHDHVNDFWGELYGIRLYYGRATGCNGYGQEGFLRGARIIRMNEQNGSFESWMRLEDGTKIENQPQHDPEFVKEIC